MALELIPIGTILAVVTNQLVKTALAAKDVVVENNSFMVLSKHLFDIEPVLKELQLKQLNDSEAARIALESLESDVKKANSLVDKYKDRSRFYLFVKCRHIVHEVQQVTRDIGRSLECLSLANTDVLVAISDQVHRLQDEMQRGEFETSHSQLQIVDKLNKGIRDHRLDQGFANDMLEEIARAVGVAVEPSEISKELASFKREKEEAASRKEQAEALFLEQVIELLSRADAARDFEEMKKLYLQRIQAIELYDGREEYISPLSPFFCCINGTIMDDPVSLSTGTTCERAAIEAWFQRGETTDPETGEALEDFSLRSNIPLRKSIEEWRELNYCLKIRACKEKFSSGLDSSAEEALSQMQNLIEESSINKDWISIAGLTDIIVSILGSSHNREVKQKILITLRFIVEGHTSNKEKIIEGEGWDHIIPCLGRDPSISKAAVELLFELLQDRYGWNVPVCRKLSQQSSGILFLVTLLRRTVRESADCAEKILKKLFDVDEGNISRAAKSGWYKPLIDRIIQGSESSRITMVRALVSMELVDSNLELLGQEGVITPLLEMVESGNIESKELSLSLLVKILSCRTNKERIASAGGVPIVLKLLFSANVRTIIIVRCLETLEKLCADDDCVKFFTDGNGIHLELERIVNDLLALQQNVRTSYNFRRPGLNTLLGLCKSEARLVEVAVMTGNGISVVLPLLDDSDSEIRELAVNLIFLFSQHEPEGVTEYLLKPKRLEALVGFLESENRRDVQMAAAGLLANIPMSEVSLTAKLIELDGVKAIIKILKSGPIKAKENALSALSRFTDPTNIESQKMVVEHGAYPLLLNLLKSGSITAKAKAVTLLGNLSLSSPKLTDVPKLTSCSCFWKPRLPLCQAHGGVCSVNTTFCLLEAKALPHIVKILDEEVHSTAMATVQTLSTLVHESFPQRGVNVLHEAQGIKPLLDVLTWGTDPLKEEVLGLLEKVFMFGDMVEIYGTQARYVTVSLAGRNIHEESSLGSKASKVMSLLERYSKSSTSLILGLFGQ